MTRPLIPPRGVFIPTRIIFDKELSGPVFQLWVQLRALAWGRYETPPMSFEQIANLIGSKVTTLYRHMAILRDRDALRWRPAGLGTFIVSFSDDIAELPQGNGSMNSQKWETLNHDLTTDQDLNSSDDLNDQVSDHDHDNDHDHAVPNFENLTSEAAKSPGELYSAITKITLNQYQSNQLASTVTDLDLWKNTLEHWMFHGWNPRNLPGIFQMYSLGGPAKCRSCQNHSQPLQNKNDPYNTSLAAIEDVFKDYLDGESQ